MEGAILVLDQGTTNTKAALVNATGRVVARGEAPVPIYHPKPGWVEQNPEEIWQSARTAAAACLQERPGPVSAIGISNQRESFLAWSARDGRAVAPCITWQCRRSADFCAQIRSAGAEPMVRAKTGLPVDPLFSAGKARWLSERASCASADLRLGTVDSWLLWKLTGGRVHACDESNASRTQLFNIREGQWDEELCALYHVPRAALPQVLPSDAEFGAVSNAPPFPDAPVRAMMGDSHAALLGHGITSPGAVKATYGTGSSLMTLLPELHPPDSGMTTTIAWHLGGRRAYALEGNILVCASSLPWAAKWLGLDGDPAKLAALAQRAEDSAGVFFIPALVGLGAPHWNAGARGLICGLSFNTGPEHLARAVMESIAFQVCDVFEAMEKMSPAPLEVLYTDGGPSNNKWLMQLQANFLGLPVRSRKMPNASALGVAAAAGAAIGLWRERDISATLPQKSAEFAPAMRPRRRDEMLRAWREAVARTLFSTEDATQAARAP